MHSISSASSARRGAVERTATLAEPRIATRHHVALIHGSNETSGSAPDSEAATLPGVHRFDRASARARWERYRDALVREGLSVKLLSSLEELRDLRRAGQTWVVAFDPEDIPLSQMSLLVELQQSSRGASAPLGFIALCSHATDPAKLCRVFQAGAYVSEKNASPSVLLKLCRHAALGASAPLTRFTQQAGLSGAEQRAFFAECAGLSKCEAADELGCSPRTLETYWSRIFTKLRIRSTDGVIAAALRFSMLETLAAEA